MLLWLKQKAAGKKSQQKRKQIREKLQISTDSNFYHFFGTRSHS